MTKLFIQDMGLNWAVGIQGDNQTEIEQQYYSFYNHGATNGELAWLYDGKFGYFWVQTDKRRPEEKIRRALESAELNRIFNGDASQFKGKKGGVMAIAKVNAARRLEVVERLEFLNHKSIGEVYSYVDID